MAAPTMNTVHAEGIRLQESTGTAAGVYTGSVVVPAGAILLDVIVYATALWTAATSATLIVGDAADDDGIFTAVNLKATDLLAAESISSALTGGKFGADIDTIAAGAQWRRRTLATERTITAKVTTVGTVGTAGDTTVVVLYTWPSIKNATFA